MGMSVGGGKGKVKSVMNVTPLVDVVLVLLIIFMVVIPMMEKSAHVELPGIFNVDPEAKGKTDPFTLSITKDGSMFFEQKQLDEDTPHRRAPRSPAARAEPALGATRRPAAHYSDVRRLFKVCRRRFPRHLPARQ